MLFFDDLNTSWTFIWWQVELFCRVPRATICPESCSLFCFSPRWSLAPRAPTRCWKPNKNRLNISFIGCKLRGGFNFFFHPENWGRFPIWLDGLVVQPPTQKTKSLSQNEWTVAKKNPSHLSDLTRRKVYPKWHPVGVEELKAMAAQKLRRRASEIDFGDFSNPAASVNTKGGGVKRVFGGGLGGLGGL